MFISFVVNMLNILKTGFKNKYLIIRPHHDKILYEA